MIHDYIPYNIYIYFSLGASLNVVHLGDFQRKLNFRILRDVIRWLYKHIGEKKIWLDHFFVDWSFYHIY